jgi:two-component system sensor histidine kinase TctE
MCWRLALISNTHQTLKGRLLRWLLIPLLLLSVAHIYTLYHQTVRTSTELYDKMLVSLALSISEYAIASEGDLLSIDLLELIRKTTKDKLYYKVLGPNGSFLVGYSDMPQPEGGLKQINNHIELYDAVYLGQQVRVIAVSMLSDRPQFSGWSSAYVAQTLQDRNNFVMDALTDNILRIIILIVIVTLLLSIGISQALRPLKRLQTALNARDIHDLTPLETSHLPKEIETLSHTVNKLFERLGNQISLTKRFLENAAHQLRTPITALTLQSELALRKADTESSKSNIRKVKQSADRVGRLANQLLQLSYSESKAYGNPSHQKIDLAVIARKGIKRFKEETKTRHITHKLQPAIIQGDEQLLLELLSNVLENAKKYSPSDELIEVSTYVDGNNAMIEIKDQGPGIPAEFRQLVTERFFRAHNDQDGSGLGLAIVKEITLVHHGKIDISQGDNNRGTRIRCLFPHIDMSQA